MVVTVGTKAYTFGNKIFNEEAVDTVDNAKVVDVTITVVVCQQDSWHHSYMIRD